MPCDAKQEEGWGVLAQAAAERRERLWGGTLDEICYGWPDLARVDRSLLARSADASGRRLLRP
jgi:hypothetical protein